MAISKRTLSPLLAWAILFNIIGFLTWGFGPLTFVCLLAVVYLFYALSRGQFPVLAGTRIEPHAVSATEPTRAEKNSFYVLAGILLIGILGAFFITPNNWMLDIGINTHLACEYFTNGLNPYTHNAQVHHQISAATPHATVENGQVFMFGIPYDYGYPYFPFMMLFYLPFTWLIDGYDSIRAANLVLLLANVWGLLLLMRQQRMKRRYQLLALIAYICVLVYSIEIFTHGIVDMLLSTLLLFTFVCLQQRWFIMAGILLGLAQASKLLPAPLVALAIFFFLWGKQGVWKFSFSYAITAAAILLPFVLANPEAYLSATILFYLSNHSVGDNTSLWFFLPQLLQTPFMLVGYAGTLFTLALFLRRSNPQWVDVMAAVFCCYLVFMAFSKMTHLNYLWSVYPLGCAAYVLLLHRVTYGETSDS